MIVREIVSNIGNGAVQGRRLEVPVLHDGDVLAETEDKRYVVRIRATEVITVPVDTMEQMGRLCYELGNRHLSIRVGHSTVSVPYDHPTYDYVQKLGFTPTVSDDDFSGFLIVKAHAGAGTVSGQHHHA